MKDLLRFKSHYLEERLFVRKVIYWMVRSDDIDDLVHDVFLKAWKSFSSFEQNSNFRTWVYKIAINTAYDYLKKSSPILTDSFDEIEDENASSLEIKDLIDKLLLSFSPVQREVFILFYKFGYTMHEIADLTGSSLGTVKSRLHYTRKKASERLKKEVL